MRGAILTSMNSSLYLTISLREVISSCAVSNCCCSLCTCWKGEGMGVGRKGEGAGVGMGVGRKLGGNRGGEAGIHC